MHITHDSARTIRHRDLRRHVVIGDFLRTHGRQQVLPQGFVTAVWGEEAITAWNVPLSSRLLLPLLIWDVARTSQHFPQRGRIVQLQREVNGVGQAARTLQQREHSEPVPVLARQS